MKYLLTLSLIFFFGFHSHGQIVDIPDENFKLFLTDQGVDTNEDGEIQISEALAVETLEIEGNDYEIMSVEGIRSFENLTYLDIHNCALMTIDVSGLLKLETLILDDIYLPKTVLAVGCTSLKNISDNTSESILVDLTGCTALESLNALVCAREFNLTNCTNLKRLELDACMMYDITLTGCTSLNYIDIAVMNMNQSFNPNFSDLISLDSMILRSYNTNELAITNVPNLSYLEVSEAEILFISSCPNLNEINIDSGIAFNYSIENLPLLENLDMGVPLVEIVHIEDCPLLKDLILPFTDITNLTLKNCVSVTEVELNSTYSQTFDFTGSSSLREISLFESPVEIILEGCYSLESFNVEIHSYTKVYDFSDCINLKEVNLGFVLDLETLILQNGSSETVTFEEPHQLRNVCVDPEDFLSMQAYLSVYVDIDAHVTTQCEFTNGGEPFSIFGASYLDVNNDSCATSNVVVPFAKYSISNEFFGKWFFYSNEEGNYNFNLIDGEYTYGPDLLYGDYVFSTYPENIEIEFPMDGASVNQDFCFIPSLEEIDIIEVNLIPLEQARPGFDASYVITYKNTGNVTRGGDIKLTFQDEYMDFLFSEPMVSVQEEGFLSWSFEDLVPFETRNIEFSMNLNSPMDTPPLNGEDVVNFKAEVGPLGNQTLTVYWSYLNQEIVNSFDPNDKTCLDGDAFDQELVGDYLKYMIRFENTGTAEAVNIVVSDTLDDTKFDIRTLQVISSSHEVETELEGNVVKFYFRDIYLPFEDATNDGYITFKLKTLPTLTLGDDIRNKAEIFFDFNFPIITNTTSTVVSDFTSVTDKEVNDFELEVSPNPTLGIVLIEGETDLTQVDVMDVSGRLLERIAFTATKKKYAVSLDSYTHGVYFIKAYSENGFSTNKVVKN